MRPIRILSVCGSGTVSSAMVSGKLKERLGEVGYEIVTVEVNPGGVESALLAGNYDFIAHTSPISGEFAIPAINAVGFLTGFGEEEFLERALGVIKGLEAGV